MNFAEYQQKAMRTNKRRHIEYYALQLVREAGEVVDPIVKSMYHKHKFDLDKVKMELGDLLWYVAAICDYYKIDIEDVAKLNIQKLYIRYPDGYSHKDSRDRRI